MHHVLFLSLENVVFSARESLDENIENSRPEERHVNAYCLEMLTKCGETPLESKIIMFSTLISNKVVIFLINGIVG